MMAVPGNHFLRIMVYYGNPEFSFTSSINIINEKKVLYTTEKGKRLYSKLLLCILHT